jgi:hypothetical protein
MKTKILIILLLFNSFRIHSIPTYVRDIGVAYSFFNCSFSMGCLITDKNLKKEIKTHLQICVPITNMIQLFFLVKNKKDVLRFILPTALGYVIAYYADKKDQGLANQPDDRNQIQPQMVQQQVPAEEELN